MTLKEQAESLGIATEDENGKAIHHKTLQKLIDTHKAEVDKPDTAIVVTEPDSKNKDGFEAGATVSTADLMKHMAQMRQKTHKVQPATKPKKKDKRKNRSKIHGGAISKPKL